MWNKEEGIKTQIYNLNREGLELEIDKNIKCKSTS